MLTRIVVVFICAVSVFAYAKGPQNHYPEVTSAQVPLYPPTAWSASLGGWVEIRVTVEDGEVVSAQVTRGKVISQNNARNRVELEDQTKLLPYLSAPSLENVKTWKFRVGARESFLVRYSYEIRGPITLAPETPRVELQLPRIVRIVARPFKPTCSHCTKGRTAQQNSSLPE